MYRITHALGGKTVGQYMHEMTMHEFIGWHKYEKEFGPVHLGLRLEVALARMVRPFLKEGTRIEDLLEWPRKPDDDEEPATLESAFVLLKSVAKSKPTTKVN